MARVAGSCRILLATQLISLATTTLAAVPRGAFVGAVAAGALGGSRPIPGLAWGGRGRAGGEGAGKNRGAATCNSPPGFREGAAPEACGAGGGGRDGSGKGGWGRWWRQEGGGGRGDGRWAAAAGGLTPTWPVDLDRNYSEFANRTLIWQGGGKPFGVDDIPDVTGQGRVAIVTGANAGIGREIARSLARKGWHVVLGCRDRGRGEEALQEILETLAVEGAGGTAELEVVDMSDFKSVRAFAWRFGEKGRPLNLLVNNAGIMLADFRVTADGVEQTFATNYLGPFLLTTLLVGHIRGAASAGFPSRIVNVGSEAHRWHPPEGICFNHSKMVDPSAYGSLQQKWGWYGHSKLALALFTKTLDDALLGEDVFVNTVHPGLIAGGAIRHSDLCFPPFFGALGYLSGLAAKPWMRTPLSGALAPLFAATSPVVVEEGVRGQFLVPCSAWRLPKWALALFDLMGWHQGASVREGIFLEPWLTGQRVAPVASVESGRAFDMELASELWDRSIEYVGYVPNHFAHRPDRPPLSKSSAAALRTWQFGNVAWAIAHHIQCSGILGSVGGCEVEPMGDPGGELLQVNYPFKKQITAMRNGDDVEMPGSVKQSDMTSDELLAAKKREYAHMFGTDRDTWEP